MNLSEWEKEKRRLLLLYVGSGDRNTGQIYKKGSNNDGGQWTLLASHNSIVVVAFLTLSPRQKAAELGGAKMIKVSGQIKTGGHTHRQTHRHRQEFERKTKKLAAFVGLPVR